MKEKLEISIEQFLKKNISNVDIKTDQLLKRVVSKLNMQYVDNETELYFLAKDTIKFFGNPQCKPLGIIESKALIYAAPTELYSFIYESALRASNESRKIGKPFETMFAIDNFYVLRGLIQEIKEIFEAKAVKDERIKIILNNFDTEISKYMRFKIMPTLRKISEDFSIQHSEFVKNMEFSLEPIAALGFFHRSDKRNIEKDQIYWIQKYVQPIIIELLEHPTGWNLIPFIEKFIYSYTTKDFESLENHGKIAKLCSPFLRRAGRMSCLPLLQTLSSEQGGYLWELTKKPKKDFKNIAFMLLGKAETGHIQHILELVRNNKDFQLGDGRRIYLLCHFVDKIEIIRQAAIGTPFTVIDATKDLDLAGGGLTLGSCYVISALKYDISDFIAVSITREIFFISGLLQSFVKKTKINLRLHYFGLKNFLGFTDSFINNIKPFGVHSEKIDGSWSTLQYTWTGKLKDESKKMEAEEVREKYLNKFNANLIIGTIARTERFTHELIDLVLDVLIKNKNLVYIYAAPREVDLFKENNKFKSVANRIEYLGFIDTFIYSKVIDLLIDTFPFGSGLIGFQMIENGNAIITLKTLQTQLSSWIGDLREDMKNDEYLSKFGFPVSPIPESTEELRNSIFELSNDLTKLNNFKMALHALFECGKHRASPTKALENLIEIVDKEKRN